MAFQIFAYILHKDGAVDDTAGEMVAAAKKIDPAASITAIVVGSKIDSVCNSLTASFKEVWKIDNDALSYPNSEVIRGLLAGIIPKGNILLVPHDHFGMDLSPGLSVKLDGAYLPDAIDFDGVDGGKLKAVRQEFSGQVSTHVLCDISGGAVITTRPGSFAAEAGAAGGSVVDKTADALAGGMPGGKRRFVEVIEAEMGDVDITKSDILVSIGRGIGEQENIEITEELAKAMGGDLSCSRPIIDAKWLEKSRQVGTSGKTVKPKVYMALGISGSFQHLGGIKGSPFMVAINKNPNAPIFQIADIGIVEDLLEFVPVLTEKINESK
ncbi:MAG: electron transfer flavoprotein subunit alpha/FixB family protein [Desulfobacterium sp.]|nr:electron transfer flavoprotein subunit alpha/FixB family protein [Desulfobacterium sp.]MBU3946761.1 electron transfer flavoprotein subunit alpha/FixB family protein [Pseudomonadota bacterium]MBU4037170.1 electron transfer flavoprotein subunit alpha/FixB family protein [Pseudomonadota bacterium]